MKCSAENVILRGIFNVLSCIPLHFMLYHGNLDYFSDSAQYRHLSTGTVCCHTADSICTSTVYIAYVQQYTSTAISLVNAVVTVAAGLSNGNARSLPSSFLLDRSQQQLFWPIQWECLKLPFILPIGQEPAKAVFGLSNGNARSPPSSFLFGQEPATTVFGLSNGNV